VWIDADADRVFEALTTKRGLDGWWGKVVQAEPRVGSVVEFDHGLGAPLRMEVTEIVPNERVAWTCVSTFSESTNPASEWHGQTFVWQITPRGPVGLLGARRDVTVLRLQIAGWPSGSRWYGFCNTAWGETLAVNLKRYCETG
jgi:uncharacterized protein YndB with AHSA1/START domain